MPALIRQLALVSKSRQIPRGDVLKVSAATQKQATRDLSPIWEISATVDPFDKLEDVPTGYWTLLVKDDIQTSGIERNPRRQQRPAVRPDHRVRGHQRMVDHGEPRGARNVGRPVRQSFGRGQLRRSPIKAASVFSSKSATPRSDSRLCLQLERRPGVGFLYAELFRSRESRRRAVLLHGRHRLAPTGAQRRLSVLAGFRVERLVAGDLVQTGTNPAFREIGPINQRANGNVRAVIDRSTMPHTLKTLAGVRQNAGVAGLTSAVLSKSTTAYAAMLREQYGGGNPRKAEHGTAPRRGRGNSRRAVRSVGIRGREEVHVRRAASAWSQIRV